MRRAIGELAVVGQVVKLMVAGCVALLVPSTAFGQGAGREPQLPGAVTKAPSWIREAPFDVAKFFELPPPSQNAAPLYLDAFFEFGEEMADCFTPDQRGRLRSAKANGERIDRVYSAWDKDRELAHRDRSGIDSLLVAMRTALRKLDQAQARPRCAFAEGMAYDSPLPHTHVCRQAVRLWTLRAIRALDRGDLDAVIGDIQRILRLSRDLRPRAAGIDQIVGAAFDSVACKILVPLVLQHPKLQMKHCDQLIVLLKEHQARLVDSFATGVSATYIMERTIFRTFEDGTVLSIDANGRMVEKTLDRNGQIRFFLKLIADIVQLHNPAQSIDPARFEDPQVQARVGANLDSLRLGLAKDHKALNEWAECLLTARTAAYPERVRRIEEVLQRHIPSPTDKPGGVKSIFAMTIPTYANMLQVSVNDSVFLGAAECLIAVKRWELLRQARKINLSDLCRAAGLERVPIDAYSNGSPLRMTQVAGETVIYSVGPDGDDDGGLKDSDQGRNPDGDVLFRLPKPGSINASPSPPDIRLPKPASNDRIGTDRK